MPAGWPHYAVGLVEGLAYYGAEGSTASFQELKKLQVSGSSGTVPEGRTEGWELDKNHMEGLDKTTL